MGPGRNESAGIRRELGIALETVLRAEALPAGTACGCVWIGNLEPALLQRVTVVEFGSRHIQGAFGVDDHLDACRFHKDVPGRGLILQIHFVLKTRASATDHGDPQDTSGPPLFGEQGLDFRRGVLGYLDQPFVADAERGRCAWWFGTGCNHSFVGYEPIPAGGMRQSPNLRLANLRPALSVFPAGLGIQFRVGEEDDPPPDRVFPRHKNGVCSWGFVFVKSLLSESAPAVENPFQGFQIERFRRFKVNG